MMRRPHETVRACPSGKKGYALLLALARLEELKAAGRAEVRVYWCRECDSAHLTSREE